MKLAVYSSCSCTSMYYRVAIVQARECASSDQVVLVSLLIVYFRIARTMAARQEANRILLQVLVKLKDL